MFLEGGKLHGNSIKHWPQFARTFVGASSLAQDVIRPPSVPT